MVSRIDPALLARARELRNNPTLTELAVWRLISRYRPAFTRQHIIEPFIIDLACREARLGVEFDGSQHIANTGRDERRTAYLEAKGWHIIRLWNSDVLSNPEGAVQRILERAAERLDGVYPEPAPSREGRTRKPRWG